MKSPLHPADLVAIAIVAFATLLAFGQFATWIWH
jgi:hypothetical protein